jgi:Ca-activated chloride channel family protein
MTVSMHAPLVLAALAAIPLGLGAVALWRRSHPPPTIGYSDVDLVAAAAPRVPLRRLAPLILLLAGAVLLVMALARPRLAVGGSAKGQSVMLVIDTSGSMLANDVAPTRLDAARDAARRFARAAAPASRIGLVSFSTVATLQVPPSTDRGALERALAGLRADGSTAIGNAVLRALHGLQEAQGGASRPHDSTIVLLSDGANALGTPPSEAARIARDAGVRVFTVALGEAITRDYRLYRRNPHVSGAPRDPETLSALAAATGGQAFEIRDPDALRSLYSSLGRTLGGGRNEMSLVGPAAGLAAILVLGGLGLAGRRGRARLAWPGV